MRKGQISVSKLSNNSKKSKVSRKSNKSREKSREKKRSRSKKYLSDSDDERIEERSFRLEDSVLARRHGFIVERQSTAKVDNNFVGEDPEALFIRQEFRPPKLSKNNFSVPVENILDRDDMEVIHLDHI